MKKIIMLSLLCTLSISCKKSDNSTTIQTTNSISNNNESDHVSYVRNHFSSTGNDVYGVSVIGTNGKKGYVIIVNGYNSKMGVGFNSTVTTDGTDGIQIVDGAADYKQY